MDLLLTGVDVGAEYLYPRLLDATAGQRRPDVQRRAGPDGWWWVLGERHTFGPYPPPAGDVFGVGRHAVGHTGPGAASGVVWAIHRWHRGADGAAIVAHESPEDPAHDVDRYQGPRCIVRLEPTGPGRTTILARCPSDFDTFLGIVVMMLAEKVPEVAAALAAVSPTPPAAASKPMPGDALSSVQQEAIAEAGRVAAEEVARVWGKGDPPARVPTRYGSGPYVGQVIGAESKPAISPAPAETGAAGGGASPTDDRERMAYVMERRAVINRRRQSYGVYWELHRRKNHALEDLPEGQERPPAETIRGWDKQFVRDKKLSKRKPS